MTSFKSSNPENLFPSSSSSSLSMMESLIHPDSLSSTLPLDPLPNGFFNSSTSTFGTLDPIFPHTPSFHFPTFAPSSPSDNDTLSASPSSSPSSSPDSPLPNSPMSPTLVDGWNNGTSIIEAIGVTKKVPLPSDLKQRVSQETPLKTNRKRAPRNPKPTRGNSTKKGGRAPKKTAGTKRKRSLKSVSPSRSPSTSPTTTPDHVGPEGKAVPVPSNQLRELLQDAVLKKQRLQRKAELARISRQKKQLKMNELENQVQALEEENRKLKAQLAQLQSDTIPRVEDQLEDPKKSIDKAVTELTNLPSSPSPASPTMPKKQLQQEEKVATLVGNVAQAFKDQSVNLEAALKVIEQALVPCTAIQFLEWSMIQKDKFYQEDGLFMSLFRDEMGATPQQIAQVLALRPQLQQQASKVKNQSLIDAFRTFESLLRSKGLQHPDAFNQLRTIFTPKQLAAYFKWVALYGAVLIKVPV